MKKRNKKGMKYIYIVSIIGTLSLIIGVFLSVIFTSEKKITKDIFSFIGGAVAGIFGFVSAFLITEQNKYLKEESDKKDVLEQLKYIILNVNRDFELIDLYIRNGCICKGYMKISPYIGVEKYIEKYKISENLIGRLKLNNYIYDESWSAKLSSIEDFNDKRKLIDFMKNIEICVKEEDNIDTVMLYEEIMDIIPVLIKYKIYDDCFENFGEVGNVWRKDKSFIDSTKKRLKALYNRLNLNELECRELSIKIDKELIAFAKEQLDKREKELDKREKELDENVENN